MAQLVNGPPEMWHSEAWAESVRAYSGDFTHYLDSAILLPPNFISYGADNPHGGGNTERVGRARRAHCGSTAKDKIALYIQPCSPPATLVY